MDITRFLPYIGLIPGAGANPLFTLAQTAQQAMQQPDQSVVTEPTIQPNGVPMYKVGPNQTFQNERGSVNRAANYGAPAEDPIDFALKRVANRMANNEGYMDRNAEQFNALSAAQVQRQQENYYNQLPAMQEAARQQKLKEDSFEKGSKLRGEFLSKIAPAQQMQEVSPILQSLIKSKDDPNGSDLDFVYGVAKILDPGSVVRSGEQDMLVRTGGLPGLVHSALEFIQGGQEKLDPELKEALLDLASRRYDALNTDYEKARGQYSKLAEAGSIRPEDLGLLTYAPSTELRGQNQRPQGRGSTGQPQAALQPPEEGGVGNGLRQTARLLGQGASFGFGDELEALARSAAGEDYDQALRSIRGDLKSARKAHPWASGALELAGGIPTGGAALKALKGVRMLASPLMQGATLGAVYGAGAGEGAGDRALQAGLGAVVGGGTAVAADALAKGVGKLASSERAQRLGEKFSDLVENEAGSVSMGGGITKRPSGRATRGPKLQNLTPEEAALYDLTINEPSERLLEGAERFGQRGASPLTPIEALDSEGALLAAKDVRNSRGGSAIFDAIMKDRSDARPRLKEIAATLSPVDDATRAGQQVQGTIRNRVEALDRGRDVAGEALYGAAHSEQPLIENPAIQELLKYPDVRDAISGVKYRFPGRYALLKDNDSLLLRKALSGIRGKASEAATAGNKELARDLAILGEQLDDAINSGGQGYELAREGYKRVMRPIDSLVGSERMKTTGLASKIMDVKPLDAHQVGQEVVTMRTPQLEDLLAATGEDTRKAMQGAARGYLEDLVDKAATEGGFEPVRKALRKGRVRDNLNLILGPEKAAELADRIEREILIDTGNKTLKSITRSGSPTTPLGQQAKAREGTIQRVLKIIGQIGKGDFGGLAGEGVDALTKAGISKNDEMTRRIANIMTGGAPEGFNPESYNVMERLGMQRAAREPYIEKIRQAVISTQPASRTAGQGAAIGTTRKKKKRF